MPMKEKYLSKRGKELNIEIPSDWEKVIKLLSDKPRTRAIIVGPIDSGKSTFANILFQSFSNQVYIMEVDPGQPTHGVPGTFNLIEKYGKGIYQYFFGELSPARNPADVLLGVNVLSRRAQTGSLIIDTSGFVNGELAIRLKLAKAVISKCDVAVVFESDYYDFQKFSYVFSSIGMSVFHLRIPDSAKKFSPEERRKRRDLIFKEYFKRAVDFEAEFSFEQVFGLSDISNTDLTNRYFAIEDKRLLCEAVGFITEAKLQSSKLLIKGKIVGKPSKYTHIKISSLVLDFKELTL